MYCRREEIIRSNFNEAAISGTFVEHDKGGLASRCGGGGRWEGGKGPAEDGSIEVLDAIEVDDGNLGP